MKYFDFNATSPLSSVAEEVWISSNQEYWQNPSGPYIGSARAKNRLEGLREQMASILETSCWIIGIGNIHLYILAFLATGLGCSVHFVLTHVKASLAKEEEAKKAK